MSEDKDEKGRFLPGNSGFGGRPKGSRNKLGEAFIAALYDDFAENGVAVIARVREEDPATYVKVCAGLLPKELRISDERELTDEQLNARIRDIVSLFGSAGIALGTDEAADGEETAARH